MTPIDDGERTPARFFSVVLQMNKRYRKELRDRKGVVEH
jgi:hypothetical protein